MSHLIEMDVIPIDRLIYKTYFLNIEEYLLVYTIFHCQKEKMNLPRNEMQRICGVSKGRLVKLLAELTKRTHLTDLTKPVLSEQLLNIFKKIDREFYQN